MLFDSLGSAYFAGVILYGLQMLAIAVVYFTLRGRQTIKRNIFETAFLVAKFTFLFYLLSWLSVNGPESLTRDRGDGRVVSFLRYIFYSACTLFLTSEILTRLRVKYERQRTNAYIAITSTMILGAVATILNQAWAIAIISIFSLAYYVWFVVILWQTPGEFWVKLYVTITWSLYPLNWALGPAIINAYDVLVESIVYHVLDGATKIAFPFLIAFA